MFKSTKIEKILFGKSAVIGSNFNRSFVYVFPPREDGDVHREIRLASDDGIILYLIKRIEKLEEKLNSKK